MKALRWYARKDLRYVDIPEPFPGSGQLKIKVSLAGICGTDEIIPRSNCCRASIPRTSGADFTVSDTFNAG